MARKFTQSIHSTRVLVHFNGQTAIATLLNMRCVTLMTFLLITLTDFQSHPSSTQPGVGVNIHHWSWSHYTSAWDPEDILQHIFCQIVSYI